MGPPGEAQGLISQPNFTAQRDPSVLWGSAQLGELKGPDRSPEPHFLSQQHVTLGRGPAPPAAPSQGGSEPAEGLTLLEAAQPEPRGSGELGSFSEPVLCCAQASLQGSRTFKMAQGHPSLSQSPSPTSHKAKQKEEQLPSSQLS